MLPKYFGDFGSTLEILGQGARPNPQQSDNRRRERRTRCAGTPGTPSGTQRVRPVHGVVRCERRGVLLMCPMRIARELLVISGHARTRLPNDLDMMKTGKAQVSAQ